jgi:hypothetical protein
MSATKSDKLLTELQAQAAKWVKKTLPERLQAVGVDENEVRKQLEIEAAEWVDYNVAQRGAGKEGTPSPDFYLHGVRPEHDPTVRTGVTEAPPEWDEEK